MLELKRIMADSPDLSKVQALYLRAFPENERRALDPILTDTSGSADLLAFYEDDCFAGFVCVLLACGYAHIIYFAVEESMRGQGYGSRVLQALSAHMANRCMVVDIESENPHADNALERSRRRAFYLKNGYVPAPVNYSWREEFYELLTFGGSIDRDQFRTFWREIREKNENLTCY